VGGARARESERERGREREGGKEGGTEREGGREGGTEREGGREGGEREGREGGREGESFVVEERSESRTVELGCADGARLLLSSSFMVDEGV
jgi:hypothetical protein